MAKRVLLIGTEDSKHEELEFVREQLRQLGGSLRLSLVVHTLDVSLSDHDLPPSMGASRVDQEDELNSTGHEHDLHFSSKFVLSFGSEAARYREVSMDRDESAKAMRSSVARCVNMLFERYRYQVVCGLGGSNGTDLYLKAIKGLPMYYPRKICLSTLSSKHLPLDERADLLDVTVIPAVCDLAGVNPLSRCALESLAGTIVGQAAVASDPHRDRRGASKPVIALTMFGNTAAAVQRAKQRLENTYNCQAVVFHSVGSGGRALVWGARKGLFDGVLDLTTTEMADQLVGGFLAAGSDRISAVAATGLPYTVVPGCLDMVNFGGPSTVPAELQQADRCFEHWNDVTTLMRTNEAENCELGRLFFQACAPCLDTVQFCIPRAGFSALGLNKFRDQKADAAFEAGLREALIAANRVDTLTCFDTHINDPDFVDAVVDRFVEQCRRICPSRFETNISVHDEPSASSSDHHRASRVQVPIQLPTVLDTDGTPRARALARLLDTVKAGRLIVGAGAGTGISAKFEEIGGADLIIIYNSGQFRMAGCGSLAGVLAYSDANQVVMDMAGPILSVVKQVPVLAGVNGTDPFRQGPVLDRFLRQVRKLGFAGVQNFPTVGLIDGLFRENLEQTGMDYGKEVELIRRAHNLGLLTSPYVFDPAQAELMTEAGADIIVAHMGLTSSGNIGARTTAFTLPECAEQIQAIADAAHRVRSDVIVLFHGGPIATPDDVRFILQRTSGLAGFYGASSMERLPVETAIVEQIRAFKDILPAV